MKHFECEKVSDLVSIDTHPKELSSNKAYLRLFICLINFYLHFYFFGHLLDSIVFVSWLLLMNKQIFKFGIDLMHLHLMSYFHCFLVSLHTSFSYVFNVIFIMFQ